MKKPVLMFVGLALVGSTAFAGTLREYRMQSGTARNADIAANRFVQVLRKELRTENNVSVPSFKIKGSTTSKRSSSILVKSTLAKGAEAMFREEMRDKPAPLDPSLFQNELRDQKRERRVESCLKSMEKEFPSLLNQYAEMIVTSNKAVETGAGDQGELIKTIRAYIFDSQPKGGGAIESILGELKKVDYADGVIQRLKFVPPLTGNKLVDFAAWMPVDRTVGITLSMLSTFRMGRDEYFVATMDCFVSALSSALKKEEERSPLEKRLARTLAGQSQGLIQMVHDVAVQDLRGSLHVNQTLSKLSVKQLNFLIDMMLQFRGDDVPTAVDFNEAKPSVISFIFKKNASGGATADAMNIDAQFYRLLHDQLFGLEDFLKEERKTAIQTSKIIKEIEQKGRSK